VYSVSFSPDGTKVASGSDDDTVKLWDVTSGECLQTLQMGCDSFRGMAFFSVVAVSSKKNDAQPVGLVDVTSGECLQTLQGHSSSVNSVSLSPELTEVATESDYERVKQWDVRRGEGV
jgi:WD40 repeat protein